MREKLIDSIKEATNLDRELIDKNLVVPKDFKNGDLAFPCFILAKTFKKSPSDCATELREKIILPKEFKKAKAVNAYLNFFLNRKEFSKNVLKDILSDPENYGKRESNGKNIVIDYASYNIAKEIHVGHLRTTFIGHSLQRIFKHLGYNVTAINYLGDWGTQFGFVYAGCKIWGKPDSADIDKLVDVYVKASRLRKMQDENKVSKEDATKPIVNEIARDYFLRLEAGEKEALDFWVWCKEGSLKYILEVEKRFGLEFDSHDGEAFFNDKIKDVEDKLRESNVLEESLGALGVDLGEELGFARIFSPDGRSLYLARDIAAALYRDRVYNPEQILYVVAMQQSLHFKQLVGVLEKFAHKTAKKIKHIGFGFVPGMKTREGGAISLSEYLNESHKRALEVYRNEVGVKLDGVDEQEIAEKVSIGASFFYFLSTTNLKDLHFSWKEVLTFQGDSGPYLQYAVARLNSVISKANEEGIECDNDFSLVSENFEDDESFYLISLLSKFNEIVLKASESYEPSVIANYVLEVSKAFSKVYRTHRILGEEIDIAKTNLSLFIATRTILKQGLYLIGVPIIERM
ncbi:MAG: arginine--tRNA ligase [Bdellovibrionota bacterium]